MPTFTRYLSVLFFSSIFFFSLLLPATLMAKANFITDRIFLDVFEKADASGPVIFTVFSGSPIEVVKVEGVFSQIKNKEAKIGWINSKYITNEKPTKIIYLQIRKKYDASLVTIRELKSKNKLTKNKSKSLKALSRAKKELATLKQEKLDLEKSLNEKTDSLNKSIGAINVLTEQLSKPKDPNIAALGPSNRSTPPAFTLPISWTIAALILSLIIGFAVGVKWLEHKISKRHGGVNIY